MATMHGRGGGTAKDAARGSAAHPKDAHTPRGRTRPTRGGATGEREPAEARGREPEVSEEERDVGQDIDGGLSAQPKANLSGGFDPVGERLQPALSQGPTGGEEGVDTAASNMTVVSDPDAPLDELRGVRDATTFEVEAGAMAMANRGNTPLPEERKPTEDDTRGRRPKGTPEMGWSQERLRGRLPR